MLLTVAHLTPLVALLAGILILIVPSLLNYIVAFYLIVVGVLGSMKFIILSIECTFATVSMRLRTNG